jgi:pimeloyl-ACP methyl ester carboxylesterase
MKKLLIIPLILLLTGARVTAQITPRWKTLPDIPVLPAPDKSGFAAVNGAKLYYAVFNEQGPDPVILLHGGMVSSEDWGFEVPRLSKTHRVIVIDSRGHGRSSMGNQPLSYDLMTADVVQLMDTIHLAKASVVGWSDGGIIGLLLAIQHPERINKLFTFGANYNHSGDKQEPPDSAVSAKFMARAKVNYSKLSPTPDGFAILRKALGKLYSAEPDIDTNELKKIKAPTVIACGEYEQFYTRSNFESLAGLIPGAKLVVMPGVSHGAPIQDPDGFHAEVIKLLGK